MDDAVLEDECAQPVEAAGILAVEIGAPTCAPYPFVVVTSRAEGRPPACPLLNGDITRAISQSRRGAWDVAGLRPRLRDKPLVRPALRRGRRRERLAARPGGEGERRDRIL